MVCAIDIYATEVLSCFEFYVLRVQPHCFALYQSKAETNLPHDIKYIYKPDTFMASETCLKWSGISKHCHGSLTNYSINHGGCIFHSIPIDSTCDASLFPCCDLGFMCSVTVIPFENSTYYTPCHGARLRECPHQKCRLPLHPTTNLHNRN